MENEETRKRGEPRYIAGTEGMELKGGDRVVVPDVLKGEEDSAMVEYYFGCDHKVTDKHGPYTVDAEECCLALAVREPLPIVAQQPDALLPAGGAFVPVIGGIIGAAAIADDDGSSVLALISR